MIPMDEKPIVLLVDDVSAILLLLSKILESEYKIVLAPNGEIALKLVEIHKPNLILLDIEMPDMDGFEICTCLKENPERRGIPIIFLSGRESGQDEAKAFALGAVDFIRKPFHPAVIRARVKYHLEQRYFMDMLVSKNENFMKNNALFLDTT
ncbi:MAG: response regulator [Magnetococcus sp. DMHC-6]